MCLAYLKHFAPLSQAVVHHRHYRRILDRGASAALFQMLIEPPGHFRAAVLKEALKFVARGDECGRARIYLNVGHTGLDDPGFRSWTNESGVRPVYFVHDLIPITHPEYCRPGEYHRHKKRIQTVLNTGIGVIGNSQATLDELEAFARTEGLPLPPRTSAWLGTTHVRNASKKTLTDRPNFVVVGTIEARKHHLFLLQVWTRIALALGPNAPQLLVIGQRGWESEQAIDLLERSATLRDAVREIPDCSDEMLAACLSNARALLFPSLAEGFGMPLIEALQAGTPVIASDLPVFREIGQGIPELLDPLHGPNWEATIRAYSAPDSPDRQEQLGRIAHFQTPTWESHFTRVESFLTTL